MLANIPRLPGSPQLHRWADWAELLCLTSVSGELSATALAVAASRRNDVREVESVDEVEDPAETETIAGETESQLSDAQTARAREVFEYLEQRQVIFGECYPFRLNNDRDLVLEPESNGRSLYTFLLYCSALRYVESGTDSSNLTARFENISVEVLRRLMPAAAEVHLFGKNPLVKELRYGGRIIDKLRLLVQDLGEEARFKDSDYEKGDSGDAGLDLVAWVPMGDDVRGRPIVFGQCACTHLWVSKQHSSAADAFDNIMSFMAEPLNMCFIPFDFRRIDGDWYKPPSIHKSIVVDRRRIFTLLGVLAEGICNQEAAADWAIVLDYERLNTARAIMLQDL